MPSRPTTGAFTCSECGRSFSLERGLTRHFNYAHAGTPMPALEPDQPAAPEEEPIWDDDLRRLAQPLQQEASKLEAELGQLAFRRDQLMGRLRPIQGALDRLKAGPGKKPGPNGSGTHAKTTKAKKKAQASEETVQAVLGWIEAHPEELAEGFTASELARRMATNGSLQMSKDRVRVAVNDLHTRSRLRLIRKTQGGGKLYRLTATRNGEQA